MARDFQKIQEEIRRRVARQPGWETMWSRANMEQLRAVGTIGRKVPVETLP